MIVTSLLDRFNESSLLGDGCSSWSMAMVSMRSMGECGDTDGGERRRKVMMVVPRLSPFDGNCDGARSESKSFECFETGPRASRVNSRWR